MSLLLLFRHRATRRRSSVGHVALYQRLERVAKRGKKKVATTAQREALIRIKKALARLSKQNVKIPHLSKYVKDLDSILSPSIKTTGTAQDSPSLFDSQIDPIVTRAINAISSEINRGILLVLIADE